MDELWQQDKLILVIGLFQFGIILLMSFIFNRNQPKVSDQSIMKPITQDKSNAMSEQSSHLIAKQLPQPMSANDSDANGDANGETNNDPMAIADGKIATAASESPSLNVDLSTNPLSKPLSEADTSYSVEISPELFKELLEISNNPAATVDEAIRWWLRRRTLDTINSVNDRRDRLGLRSHRSWKSLEESWND
ncbi:hypothetical protein H6F44_06930 [Pseudanabaena sp. FACHB-1277]|uniref:Uncharacterized protein n=1 Tax=Pseudanabaena cinerea FACHB-1277 TaxID=2949581 RepID=A0A926US32_9CYAN|nr:hypothetical protein [Pseudanabaena cinerea]MBD2149858.1 hypothetical protein [Pseudanabaena cinerea FACHB-1277]